MQTDMKKIFVLVLFPMLFASCGINQNVSVNGVYPAKEHTQIVHSGQALPQGLMRIGSITVGDTGFTFSSLCTYESCMQTIASQAAKAGADVAYIVRIKEPMDDVGGSSCHTITADLYVYAK